jgi:hypothetical protein
VREAEAALTRAPEHDAETLAAWIAKWGEGDRLEPTL